MKDRNAYIDYELIARFLDGSAAAEEGKSVRDWIAKSKSNKAEFERLERLWRESGSTASIDPALVDVEKGWDTLTDRLHAGGSWIKRGVRPVPPPEKMRRLAGYIARVAAVFVLVLMAWYLYRTMADRPEEIVVVAEQSIVTKELPDGSTITLNNDTEVAFPEAFTGRRRVVKLRGEAFFEVQPDPERPFVVETAHADIRVLGTSFNAHARESDDYVEVIVEKGIVELTRKDGSGSVTLTAGERGLLDLSNDVLKKTPADDPNALFWKSKTLVFRNTDVFVVMETLSANYDVEIAFRDESHTDCSITGIFRDYTIDDILDRIAESCNLKIEKTGGKYVVSPADP